MKKDDFTTPGENSKIKENVFRNKWEVKKKVKRVIMKHVFALVMAVMMLVTSVFAGFGTSITARADEGVTLKLHYHREDGDYAKWDAWE